MNQNFRVGQTYFPHKPRSLPKQTASTQTQRPFQQWLADSLQADRTTKIQPLSFSQHALSRLQERGIELDAADVTKLEGAVQKAAEKGAKESLIMMDNVAYVVSVVNRKVITAVDDRSMKESVFTNIDSAIFL